MSTPEEQAAIDAAQEKALRDLAAQIGQMAKLGFDPMTIRKAEVASVNDTTNPPTVAINISGDTETLITQVRTVNNFTPLAGQTVLVAKQGTEIFILGAIASASAMSNGTSTTTDDGWIQATLSNGSHNGNSNGTVEYRRIMDNGSWKMQWRGGWTTSGSTTMISSGGALDSDYRPANTRTILCGRDGNSTGVNVNFNTDGSVTLSSSTAAPSGTTGSSGSFSVGGHNHSHTDYYGASGEFSLVNVTSTDPGFSVGSHTHSFSGGVSSPGWVSLNRVEYFL